MDFLRNYTLLLCYFTSEIRKKNGDIHDYDDDDEVDIVVFVAITFLLLSLSFTHLKKKKEKTEKKKYTLGMRSSYNNKMCALVSLLFIRV